MTPRFASHSRTAISSCVVTGIPSVSLTPLIAFSNSGSNRKDVVVLGLIVMTSIYEYTRSAQVPRRGKSLCFARRFAHSASLVKEEAKAA